MAGLINPYVGYESGPVEENMAASLLLTTVHVRVRLLLFVSIRRDVRMVKF